MEKYTGFTGVRPIPKKIEIIGKRDKGADYLGVADGQLKILENQMSLSEGQTIGTRIERFGNCIVEAWKNMDLCGVRVTILGEEDETRREKQRCFCDCHVAIGYVQNTRHNCYDFINNTTRTYDVVVCNDERLYVLIKDALPMTFTPFRNGERVLVIFEPDVGEQYIPGIKQGCHSVYCRISNIYEDHKRFYPELT